MARGRFITFEGGEGAGKSTQAELLAAALGRSGIRAHATREPGGSPGGEDIRRLLVTGEADRWDPLTEALLHFAARCDHLRTVIRPCLGVGDWVVSDRFADSTMAYQGYGHGLGRDTVEALYRLVVGDFAPDLTLILDVPVEVGFARATSGHRREDRYLSMGYDFHERVRQAFREIALTDRKRYALIDGTQGVDEVFQTVCAEINQRLSTQLDSR